MLFRPWRSNATIASLVFMLGVCVAAAGAWWLHRDIDAQTHAAFERSVARVSDEVVRRFHEPINGLNGVKGMYAARQRISRPEFRAYFASHDLAREYPGVRGFGFIQRVMRGDVDRFVAAERADSEPTFAIRELVDKGLPDLYVVKFAEPPLPNSGALGLDLGSEARRRATVQRAIDSGEPTLTAAITLVQDRRRSPGVVLYVPAYAQGAPVSTVEERRAALLGLMSAPIVIAELLDGVLAVVDGQLDVQLFDGAPGSTLVYEAGERLTEAVFGGDPARARRFHSTRKLLLPGRDYLLRVAGTPQFEAAYARTTPLLVFGGGVLISAMLALLLWQQASRRRRAESMARRMTAEMDRLAQVVKHTWNAVTITDRELRITWVNEGFTRHSGYTLAEALGKTPGELLGSGKAEPSAVQALADSAAAGKACRVEILNRAKDGREYWIDTEIQPLHDAQGLLTGFMEIGSDVTATKNAERELARERASLANIIEGTNAGTWECNVETGAIHFNERWAQMIGYTLDELSPCTVATWQRLLHPDDHAHSVDQCDRHFSGELPAYECEVRLRHKCGHWIWVQGRGKVFSRTEAGAPRWMAGTHLDISARKQAEAALRASQELLDQAGRIGRPNGRDRRGEVSVARSPPCRGSVRRACSRSFAPSAR
jgi:PAS domain S-box-containing protein